MNSSCKYPSVGVPGTHLLRSDPTLSDLLTSFVIGGLGAIRDARVSSREVSEGVATTLGATASDSSILGVAVRDATLPRDGSTSVAGTLSGASSVPCTSCATCATCSCDVWYADVAVQTSAPVQTSAAVQTSISTGVTLQPASVPSTSTGKACPASRKGYVYAYPDGPGTPGYAGNVAEVSGAPRMRRRAIGPLPSSHRASASSTSNTTSNASNTTEHDSLSGAKHMPPDTDE